VRVKSKEPLSMADQSKAKLFYVLLREQVCEYQRKPFKRGFNHNTGLLKTILNAVRICEELSVTYEMHIQAQIYWFDKWFNRAPVIPDFISEKARLRTCRYVALQKSGVAIGAVRNVAVAAPAVSAEVLDKVNFTRLRNLCLAWGLSVEEVLINFGPSGVFDQQWLEAQPLYQQLRKDGKLPS
jgi:hypothetical protein